jgi:predicted 3-demethylubiquinone-9 3-methyltransferase (glyoxalase superfamily)
METNEDIKVATEPSVKEQVATAELQKIVPFLWFNDEAEEAMNFYTSVFSNAKVTNLRRYGDAGPGKKGAVMTGTFKLGDQEFYALNGGPMFNFTPAVSFFVSCETEHETDALWKNLAHNGTVLMELKQYPFSKKYGWVQDRFGLSWQLNFTGDKQKIAPCLMFTNEHAGQAEKAINFYTSMFSDSEVQMIARYEPGEGDFEGNIKHAAFVLHRQEFKAMDSGIKHLFGFSPAVSLFVKCQSQQEVDDLWERFSEGGEKGQCGWLKDRFGISWQIIPNQLGKLLGDPDPIKANRVMKAMMQMTKIDIAGLQRAYEG